MKGAGNIKDKYWIPIIGVPLAYFDESNAMNNEEEKGLLIYHILWVIILFLIVIAIEIIPHHL